MFRLSSLRPLVGIAILVVCSAQATADGLIFQLPPDGAWVTYRTSEEGEATLSAPNDGRRAGAPKNAPSLPINSSGSLRLSSVGRLVSEGEPCRWIELKMEVEITGKLPDAKTGNPIEKKEVRRIILKLLIAEKELTIGTDPLAHVRRLYFKDGDRGAELIKDEKAKQYEIDRFRPVFPKPAVSAPKADKRTSEVLDTQLGKLECEKLTFDSDYEGPLARGRRGWWSWRGKHEIWLNDQVPFGVAALKLAAKSSEWSGEKERSPKATVESTKFLIVRESGEGAKSELPDSN